MSVLYVSVCMLVYECVCVVCVLYMCLCVCECVVRMMYIYLNECVLCVCMLVYECVVCCVSGRVYHLPDWQISPELPLGVLGWPEGGVSPGGLQGGCSGQAAVLVLLVVTAFSSWDTV